MARGQLELQSQIDALRQDLAKLRGNARGADQRARAVQRRQREMASEIDARIKPFEPVQVQIDEKASNVQPDERRTFDGSLALFRAGDFAGAISRVPAAAPALARERVHAGRAVLDRKRTVRAKGLQGRDRDQQAMLASFPDHPRAPTRCSTWGSPSGIGRQARGARHAANRLRKVRRIAGRAHCHAAPDDDPLIFALASTCRFDPAWPTE